MENKDGFSFETRRALGFGRSRFIEAFIKYNESKGEVPLPADIVEDDMRCDAELNELTPEGDVVKSAPPKVTRG